MEQRLAFVDPGARVQNCFNISSGEVKYLINLPVSCLEFLIRGVGDMPAGLIWAAVPDIQTITTNYVQSLLWNICQATMWMLNCSAYFP